MKWDETDEAMRIIVTKFLDDAKHYGYKVDHTQEIDAAMAWLKSLKDRV